MIGWKLEMSTLTPPINMLGQFFFANLATQLWGNQICHQLKTPQPALGKFFFKTNFASSIYEAQTSHKLPHPKHAAKEDKIAFKKFKSQHENAIMSENNLFVFFYQVQDWIQYGMSTKFNTDQNPFRRCRSLSTQNIH